MKKVHGVVVLYNPDVSIIDNIRSYIDHIELLYIVDNSTQLNKLIVDKLKAIPKCKYINNHGNKGIAHALNVGAKLAIENGADWLLTMDQDSKFEDDNFSRLYGYTIQQDDKVFGVISPLHKTSISVQPPNEVDELLTIMTSGNMISLFAYKAIGGFDEDYFIDAVDWDYCLRLNINNFKVIRLNTAHLNHGLGNASCHTSPLGNKIIALNYNKVRRYYITRNKLMMISRYKKHFPKLTYGYFKSLFRDLRHILLYESGKIEKLNYMIKGVSDYLIKRKGKRF